MEKKTVSESVPAEVTVPRKGKKPWEMTIEEAEEEGRQLAERFAEADRIASGLFARQLAELDKD